MKISYRWLSDYLNTPLTPGEAGDLLTSTGLEVEGIEAYERVKGSLEGVVIGQVLTVTKHPDADKLSVCTVDVGKDAPLTIVCGAPNVAAGQKVPVALVGSTLYPNGQEESFTIKKAKIRGQVSEGMICAEDELGLGNNHEGILVLNPEAPVGSLARDYFNVYQDTILEIGLTPNRTDAMSHYGVARDLAACINFRENKSLKLKPPKINPTPPKQKNALKADVKILNRDACRRYTAVVLTEVHVTESPEWLRERLEAIGIKPHNNVVDVTNYVLHELGHPLHAFDYGKIKGGTIEVGNLPDGTPFTTLDGVERKLSQHDLMICDTEKPLCIAGVYGGIGSGVTTETTSVFLESAWFDPVTIRKTARLHGLNTDASFRFERGADPEITITALNRAVTLLCEITGAKVCLPVTDQGSYAENPPANTIELRLEKLVKLIGQQISTKDVTTILHLLDFELLSTHDDLSIILKAPAYRTDVTREADVIEEVLRIYGMNRIDIPTSVPVAFPVKPVSNDQETKDRIAAYLVNNGFNEAWNNSLVAAKDDEAQHNTSKVFMLNPLSQELNVLRESLLPGLLENARHNINRKTTNLRIFEFGKRYQRNPEANVNHKVTERFRENRMVAVMMAGKSSDESWYKPQNDINIWDIKHIADQLLLLANVSTSVPQFVTQNHPFLNQCAGYGDESKPLAFFGKVKEEVARKAGVKQTIWYAEIDMENLKHHSVPEKINFKPLPKFPDVRRDLSLVMDQDIPFGRIADTVKATAPNLVHHVLLFDVYEKGNLPKGKKAYAIGIVLRSAEKTLEDKEIDKVMDKILRKISKETGAVLR
jgi:phenylalanyl-tRNA synthetase beta chain